MLTEKKINTALDKVWGALFNGLKLPVKEATRITNLVEVELNKLNK
tara:strand:- start:2 stop:139 length:138 start_codon:yes stop_codon:yes gene_type:complete